MWSGGRVWCGSGKMSLAEELASRAPVGRILISRQKLAKTDSKDRQQKLVSTRNSEKTPFVPTTGKHNFNRTKLRQPTALANTQADGEHQMFFPLFSIFSLPPLRCMLLWFVKQIIGESFRSRGFLVSTDLRQPGVAGSSPFTLTTSLAILIPSSSSPNGPNMNNGHFRIDSLCRECKVVLKTHGTQLEASTADQTRFIDLSYMGFKMLSLN